MSALPKNENQNENWEKIIRECEKMLSIYRELKYKLCKEEIKHYTIDNNEFNIHTKIYWHKPINNKEPMIWKCETIQPGNLEQNRICWYDEKPKWDKTLVNVEIETLKKVCNIYLYVNKLTNI